MNNLTEREKEIKCCNHLIKYQDELEDFTSWEREVIVKALTLCVKMPEIIERLKQEQKFRKDNHFPNCIDFEILWEILKEME